MKIWHALVGTAFLILLSWFFVLPVIVKAEPATTGVSTEFSQSKPMKIAIGPCQSQCFEGAVEYNPDTLKVSKLERFDTTSKAWTAMPGNIPDTATQALMQVTQNMTLPGQCPESECSCVLPDVKPPFGSWSNIPVTADFVVKGKAGASSDFRVHGTVDYRSRVTQGQCDICPSKAQAATLDH